MKLNMTHRAQTWKHGRNSHDRNTEDLMRGRREINRHWNTGRAKETGILTTVTKNRTQTIMNPE